MIESQIEKDLAYYEPRMSPQGPAMGFSVLATLYARLGNTGKSVLRFYSEVISPMKCRRSECLQRPQVVLIPILLPVLAVCCKQYSSVLGA